MDFRGMTWAGKNVYQKFEAMCLEVEDIIVLDMVKYIENQVQTVGATVKKLYSEMAQDLLTESSVHEYASACSFTKKKEGMNGETKEKKKLSGLSTVDRQYEKGHDVESVSSCDHKDNGNRNENGLTAVDSIKSKISDNEQCVTAAGSYDCAKETDEDSWDLSHDWEQNKRIIQQLSQRPFEGSCVLVDRDDTHCIAPPHESKHDNHKSSYTKIRDTVYSKMRSAREEEYKRLAARWCMEEAESGLECDGTEDNRPLVQHKKESDWELL